MCPFVCVGRVWAGPPAHGGSGAAAARTRGGGVGLARHWPQLKARAGQGILIASGMMAGAAIIGIVTAVLRLDMGSGALEYPIRLISIGEKFAVETNAAGDSYLAGTAAHWYEGFPGQILSLVMFVALAGVCFLLARWGAGKELEEQAAAKKGLEWNEQ